MAKKSTRRPQRLRLETLEDRCTPALAVDWAEPNNTLAAAPYLGRGGNLTWNNLAVSTSTDVDYLEFRLASPGTGTDAVSIDFNHTLGDLDVQLFDSNGRLLNTSAGTTDTESISLAGRAAGDYRLKVYGFAGATGNYTFKLRAQTLTGGDFLEVNDAPGNAFTIPNRAGGFNMFGMAITDSTDDDWYYFRLADVGTAADFVRVNFTHANGDIDMRLYRASDPANAITSSTGSVDNEEISLSGLAAGAYYLEVYGYQGATNTYTFNSNTPAIPASDVFENNDSLASASDLGNLSGRLFRDNLSIEASDDDYYRFTLGATGTPADGTSLAFTHTNGDVDLQLLDGNGTVVSSSTSVNDGERVSFAELPAGTYYLRAYGFAGAANDNYTLSITAPESAVADASEPNDTRDTPTELGTVAGSVRRDNRSIHTATDEDWYRFTLAAPGTVDNTVRVDFPGLAGDIDIGLYDVAGNLVRSSNGTGDFEQVALTGLAAGTYTVKVFGFAGALNPNYSLVVTGPDVGTDRFESNNDASSAKDLGTLRGEQVIDGLSLEAGDEDWYAFTLASAGSAGHFVRVNFAHGLGDIDAAIVDSNGTPVVTATGAISNETLSLAGLAAGTYRLRVYGFAGAGNPRYSISVTAPGGTAIGTDRLGSNDTMATATRINEGDDLNDLSITVGDQDYFMFDLANVGTEADSVTIRYEQADTDLQLELYDLAGNLVETAQDTEGAKSFSMIGRAVGTYVARVTSAISNAVGGYRIESRVGQSTGNNAKADWTVMSYITASNLQSYARDSIEEMERALAKTLPGSVKLTVFWDQSENGTSYPTAKGNQPAWTTAGRAVLKADSKQTRIATRFEIFDEVNTGAQQTLTDFLDWSKQVAPARKYALIMWGHGGGPNGVNYDDEGGSDSDQLDIIELRDAIQSSTVSLNVLAFDACNMAMFEAEYMLRDQANFIVASQAVIPGSSYNYLTAFDTLNSTPRNTSGREFADGLVTSYDNRTSGLSVQGAPTDTLSNARTSRLDELATALRQFTDAVGTNPSSATRSAIKAALDSSISFDGNDFYDLGYFMFVVANTVSSTAIQEACQAVSSALTEAVVSSTTSTSNSTGLSIYAPKLARRVPSAYRSDYTAFNTATGWVDFLERIFPRSSSSINTEENLIERADNVENNNLPAVAFNLGTLSGAGHVLPELNLTTRIDADYFRFSTTTTGDVTVRMAATDADTVTLTLFGSDGLTPLDTLTGTGTLTRTLSNVAAGTYFARVTTTDTQVPAYTLSVDAPGALTNSDLAGDNHSADKPRELGLFGAQTLAGLVVVSGSDDYFAWETPRLPTSQRYQVIVNGSAGAPLTAQLRDEAGNVIATNSGTGRLPLDYTAEGDGERLTLIVSTTSGTPAPYAVLVNPIAPPVIPMPPPPTGNPGATQVVVGGRADGTAQVYNFASGQAVAQGSLFTPFPGVTAQIRTASADVNGDGVTDQIYATGPGGGALLRIVNGANGLDLLASTTFDAYAGENFTTIGLFLAAADIDGDGKAEIAVAPDQGGGARVQVFSFSSAGSLTQVANFFAIEDPAFRGGGRIALGDINGDGRADMIAGAGFGGGPRIALFNGVDLTGNVQSPRKLIGDFLMFEAGLRDGVFVAAGDVNGDGKADLIFGGGPGGGPRVQVLDGAAVLASTDPSLTEVKNNSLANFFAFDVNQRGGVHVGVKNVDGDTKLDLVIGSGDNAAPAVSTFLGSSLTPGASPTATQTFSPFSDATLANGIFVG
jgi:hypothetical protein